MKKMTLMLIATAALMEPALAADLAVYTKAPAIAPPSASWTGFYIFGGAGGGLWKADSNNVVAGSRDQRLGGDGWFGTVGAGYDWQFDRSWVAGVFADGQFGSIRGSLVDTNFPLIGNETLRTSYAVGARLGYLVAPNVLSYVNAGYSGSQWSGATLSAAGFIVNGAPITPVTSTTTPSFSRSGWFVGGGVENSLNIFGISAPGWFMKTEYRAAYYGRVALAEAPYAAGNLLFNEITTFKPWVQTVSTSLVYRFNSNGPVTSDLAVSRAYTKAPVMASNWTGFYAFGGAGGGLWDARTDISGITGPGTGFFIPGQKSGGDGWFGTVGLGYDWQFNRSWVAGIFADGQFGSLTGSLADPAFPVEGNEKLRTSYAAGVRVGYLVAPNVLSYLNAGYSGSQWSGVTLTNLIPGGGPTATTASFNRDGWFFGGGVENSLNIFGISAPGWFMKTEYRAAYYGRATIPETQLAGFNDTLTFKPIVQTVSTSLVYRFNQPVVAKY